MKKILGVLLIIAISLFCLLISVELNAFNLDLYSKSFKEHNANTITGRNFNELEGIAENLILYLDEKASEEILEADFNNKEILHMEDVKELFILGRLLKNISIILIISSTFYFYINKEKRYVKFVFWGIFSNWIILIGLTIMIYSNFNKYFTIFHHIFFTNDLWLLDPKTDLLIQMLPEDFFMTMAIRIVVFFVTFLTIIQGVLYIIMRRDSDKYGRQRQKEDIR